MSILIKSRAFATLVDDVNSLNLKNVAEYTIFDLAIDLVYRIFNVH